MAEIQISGAVPEFRLADRLRRAREYADLHQAELADDIDVSRRQLGKYEAGDVVPKRHVLIAWALRCGVDSTWLLTGVVPPGHDGLSSGESRDTNRYPALRDVTGLTPGLRLAGEPPRSPLRLVPPRSPAPHGSADATEQVAA